ncbi:hypothetical protein [Vibrio sp. F74]|uniref:hypothetical protein n=1 Tax=Vibrio sp. F74 TaxID=700020 RepID=UPI0035F592FF
MPYRYTGKFTEYSTGLVQHELIQFTGVNTLQLLNDLSQRMAFKTINEILNNYNASQLIKLAGIIILNESLF